MIKIHRFHSSDWTSVDYLNPRRWADGVCTASPGVCGPRNSVQASLLDLVREAGYIWARGRRAVVALATTDWDCSASGLGKRGAVYRRSKQFARLLLRLRKLEDLPEASPFFWAQLPPRPLSWLITDVTSAVSGEPLEVWQVTPFWRGSRIGDPSTTGRAAKTPSALALEKCICYQCKCDFIACAIGLALDFGDIRWSTLWSFDECTSWLIEYIYQVWVGIWAMEGCLLDRCDLGTENDTGIENPL